MSLTFGCERPASALQKSSVAELPLNLTWNIYAFSGSFSRKERGFRMTARFRGKIYAQPAKSK
jgi:hypothetical protein